MTEKSNLLVMDLQRVFAPDSKNAFQNTSAPKGPGAFLLELWIR